MSKKSPARDNKIINLYAIPVNFTYIKVIITTENEHSSYRQPNNLYKKLTKDRDIMIIRFEK